MDWTFERLSTGRWAPPLSAGFFADRGLCGVSGNDGLLRFHDDVSGPAAQEFVDVTFGVRGVRAEVFAFDWRARQFALTTAFAADGAAAGGPTIVTLDPFDMIAEPWGLPADAFEHAVGLEVVEKQLRPDLFEAWRRAQDVPPLSLASCAGVSMPGFFGGHLDVENLELNLTEVYLSFVAQLWTRTSAP
ncbi:hypothetical protein [Gordonia aurantiaca]|uniref:hypothetical protein n=1 Tax=Gordonia sp. B21 TaxID=3151852 RepID=UPI0032662382